MTTLPVDSGRAQAVNEAVAAEQCHWRGQVIDRDATIAELRTRLNIAETTVAVLQAENERLRAFAGKELI